MDTGGVIEGGKNNFVYLNNFYDCRDYAREDAYRWENGPNYWDNNETENPQGNYWKGYYSEDKNKDGILDKPLQITGDVENQDRYPLKKPVGGKPKTISTNIDNDLPVFQFVNKIIHNFPLLQKIFLPLFNRIVI